MSRIAVFVEGQTELIFVKTLLLIYYDYNVDIKCNKLYSGEIIPASYDYNVPNASVHYRLIDVGNDSVVLQRMIDRELYLENAGYTKVIGLRDMYSAEYLDAANEISLDIIRKFINASKAAILLKSKRAEMHNLCFAIMEIESWFIGLNFFNRIHDALTPEAVKDKLKMDIEKDDPEQLFLRPSSHLKEVYSLAGKKYDKSEGVIESFCSHLTTEDCNSISNRNICKSFSYFKSKLLAL